MTPKEIEETVTGFVDWINSEFGVGAEMDYKADTDQFEEPYTSVNVPGQGHIYIGLETGEVKTQLTGALPDKLREALGKKPTPPAIRNSEPKRAISPRDVPVRDLQVAELTVEMIRDYLCPLATPQEAYLFLQVCQARKLNPFLSEVYLIKYNEKDKAQIVTGKDAFTKRASETPNFRYFRAGVIVQKDDELTEREGTFFAKGEDLIGGWAEVYLEGREHPFKYTIRREEFDKKQANWLKMPGVMCRKCALVGALREALPEQLGGLYDSAEMRDAPDIMDIEGEVIEG